MQRFCCPIAIYMFCTAGLVFILLHPSVVFVPVIPVICIGYFAWSRNSEEMPIKTSLWFKIFASCFLGLCGLFTLSLYTFYFMYFMLDDTYGLKFKRTFIYYNYTADIFGFISREGLQTLLFPPQQEFIFLYVMVLFCKYLLKDISPELYKKRDNSSE